MPRSHRAGRAGPHGWVGAALLVAALGAHAATTLVPVSGTVGGAPEAVVFSGNLHVSSRLVTDPDFGKAPSVHLSIDMIDVVGKGMTSGARYVSHAEFVNSAALNANETIELTFPFHPDSRKGYLVARAGMLALTLKFDARNGAILGAACRISGLQ
jgi:hypothetical protein